MEAMEKTAQSRLVARSRESSFPWIDKRLGTPSIIVVGGFGWSDADILHAMLNGSVCIEMLEDWLTFYMKYQKQNPDCILPSIRSEATEFD